MLGAPPAASPRRRSLRGRGGVVVPGAHRGNAASRTSDGGNSRPKWGRDPMAPGSYADDAPDSAPTVRLRPRRSRGWRSRSQSTARSHSTEADSRHSAALRVARRSGAARPEVRLRPVAMRRLLRARGRQGDPLLRDAGRGRRGQEGDHAGGVAGLVCGAEAPGNGAGTASAAAGLDRRAGSTVRLLPERDDRHGGRSPVARTRTRATTEIKQAMDPHLCRCATHNAIVRAIKRAARGGGLSHGEHHDTDSERAPEVHPQRVPEGRRRADRRDRAPRGRVGLHQRRRRTRPTTWPAVLDPSSLDSWLAIHADGTVTAFTGKTELGQGNRTALSQIVAEELDVPFDRDRRWSWATPRRASTRGRPWAA